LPRLQALPLIPRLLDTWGNWAHNRGHIYFEPVKPEDALKSLRDLRLR
jgi:hypothetical protein